MEHLTKEVIEIELHLGYMNREGFFLGRLGKPLIQILMEWRRSSPRKSDLTPACINLIQAGSHLPALLPLVLLVVAWSDKLDG
jgi:hypothetical protein